MTKTRALLSSALVLSLAALVSVVMKPRPAVPKAGAVVSSQGAAVRLDARSSHVAVHENGSELYAEYTVTLEGPVPPPEHVALALVLDRSGSMAGQKLADARRAAHRMVDLLKDGDELALIAFGSDVTGGERRRLDDSTRVVFHQEIDRIESSGGTFISGGLEAGRAALASATGARRLVLVSDGQPTEGLTDEASLARQVAGVHEQSITVSALGVGSDYDGMLMQHLSEQGGGMYGYLKDAAVLEEVLGKEIAAARLAVARNVTLELSSRDFAFLDAPGRHAQVVGDVVRLPLADLRPGLPTSVVVHLRSQRSDVGATARVTATAKWRTDGAQQQTNAVALAAVVVDDLSVPDATRDEPMFARGVTAAGSLKMLAAAAAFERGDEATANGLLDNARALFGMSADALAGQVEVDQARSSFGSANTEQRKSMARGLEKKKLSTFGRGNEGY